MALKATISAKSEFEGLSEAIRALYVEKDGKWILDAEGLVPKSELDEVKTKLVEFRDNNRTMHDELKDLKPLKEKLKDVKDIDAFLAEHAELKTKAGELKDKGVEGKEDLQKIVAAALKPIQDQLSAAETARQVAQSAADTERFRNIISSDATKAGVRPNSIRFVIAEAERVFELKDGVIKPRPGQKHPDDPLKDLSPEVWLTQLARTDENLFAESNGGGANNDRRGGNGGAAPKELRNPTALEMGKHMDDIASGKMVVVRG